MAEIGFPPLLEVWRRFQAQKEGVYLADAISPTFCLENDRPEWSFLGGELRGGASIAINNTPGTVWFHGQLYNPAGSGVLAVIDRIVLVQSCPTALFGPSTYLLSEFDTPLTDLHLVSGPHDRRWDVNVGTNRRTVCQLRTQINATSLSLSANVGRLRNVFGQNTSTSCHYSNEWTDPLILAPGTGFMVQANGQTASRNDFQFCYVWRERQMSSWERQAIPGG